MSRSAAVPFCMRSPCTVGALPHVWLAICYSVDSSLLLESITTFENFLLGKVSSSNED